MKNLIQKISEHSTNVVDELNSPNFEARLKKVAIGLYVASAIVGAAMIYSACHEKHTEKADLAQNYSSQNK